MARILIVDDTAIIREPIAVVLSSAGYQIDCAEDGTQALAKMRVQAPDLVLLDLSMPKIDGLTVLRMMRRESNTAKIPVILLTASTDKSHIFRAAELGVRDYLLKTKFNIAELLTRVRKYIPSDSSAGKAIEAAQPANAAATAPGSTRVPPSTPQDDQQVLRDAAKAANIPLLTRAQMLARMESARVKTLPGGVAELIGIISSPRGTVIDVAQSLKRDPVLASRVLRVSNSAAFASQRPRIATVEDAVKHVGLSGVQNLVTSVGVFETIGSGPGGRSVLRSWQHSLAVAALMNLLTPESDAAPRGVAYIVGLCHDLADIILRQYFCEEYEHVVELTRTTGQPQRRVEAGIFGLPYSELVEMLLSRLGLPGVVTAPIQEFFEREPYRQPSGAGSPLGRSLRIANVYAHGLMLAPGLDEPVLPFSKVECQNTFSEQTPSVDDGGIRAESLTTAAILAGLSASETAEACLQPIPKRPLRLGYVRHEEYADLDPLQSLLRLSAQRVDLLRHLPSKRSDLDQMNALVVVASRSDGNNGAADLLRQVASVVKDGPLPVLLLTPTELAKDADKPPCITVGHLPTGIQTVGRFLEDVAARKKKAA